MRLNKIVVNLKRSLMLGCKEISATKPQWNSCSIGTFYGSTTGNTRDAAYKLEEEFGRVCVKGRCFRNSTLP